MTVQIHKNDVKTRCYKCGTTEIEYICHHCGKPMCTKHASSVCDRKTSKLLSEEFSKLNLGEGKETPWHCEDCLHIVRDIAWKFVVAGILLLSLSVVAIPNNRSGLRLLGVLTGGGLAAYGVSRRSRKPKPPLPVLPDFDQIQIRETLQGHITLNEIGDYRISVDPAKGQLDIAMSFTGSDRARLKLYRKKYGSFKTEDLSFHAGFVVLEGSAGFQFNDDVVHNREGISPYTTVIPLDAPVSTQPFLKSFLEPNGSDELNSEKQKITRNYSIQKTPDSTSFPIWLILSLVPESDQRNLELEIQWSKLESTKTELKKLEIEQIEFLELSIPTNWGYVKPTNENALIKESESEKFRSITWRRIPIKKQERQEGRYTFSITCENKIALNDCINGRIRVIFQGTLSGLENVSLYLPTGQPQRKELINTNTNKIGQEKSTIKTEIYVDFNLSLAGLRYQDIRVVPDPQNPDPEKKKRDKDRQESSTFKVSPNYATIIALTEAMSEQNFYLKQVIENKPTTHESANVFYHAWKILGRSYDGVYPINFRLTLTGEEKHKGRIGTESGTTTTSLTVQGTYCNQEMEEKIEHVWDQLNYLIGEKLEELSQKTSSSTELPSSEPKVIQQPVRDEGVGEETERIKTLCKRLDELDEAVIQGRITQSLYEQLKTKIEQELQNLNNNC